MKKRISVFLVFSFFLSFYFFSQEFEIVKWRYVYEGYLKERKERELPRRAEMALDISDKVSEFYSPVERRVLFVQDSLLAKGASAIEILETIRELFVRDYQDYTVYKNYPKQGKTLFVDRILKEFYLYETPLLLPEWKIESEQKEILSYNCQKATTNFLGRKWTVWFAADIPISNGPWKLGGLPGLILQAEEAEGDYSFTCIAMQKVENGGEIRLPKRNYVKCTKEEFLKEKLFFISNPEAYLKKSGLGAMKRVMPDGSVGALPKQTASYIER